MRRGDLVLAAAAGDYGKPRPYLVVQADRMVGRIDSLLVCPLTTQIRSLMFRVLVEPSATNGLDSASEIMIDKTVALATSRIRSRIGTAEDAVMTDVDAALAFVLGLGATSSPPRG